jgi:hypothetical protein
MAEQQPVDFLRFLAHTGAELATLSIAAGGGSLMFTVRKDQLWTAIESAAAAARKMEEKP